VYFGKNEPQEEDNTVFGFQHKDFIATDQENLIL